MQHFDSFNRLKSLFGQRTVTSTMITHVTGGLVFDDEPLDSILYGEQASYPTPASIFASARDLLDQVQVEPNRSPEDTIRSVLQVMKDAPLDNFSFDSLVVLAHSHLPKWPEPPADDMPASLGALLTELWTRATRLSRDEWQISVGSLLWEWHEYQREYAAAREILNALIELHQKRGKPHVVASLVNNLAYQHFLQCNWKQGVQEFERAARLQSTEQAIANSMMNYWACRIELGDVPSAKIACEHLTRYLSLFQEPAMPMAQRKCLVYLARLDANEANYESALHRINAAVAINQAQAAIFLDQDIALRDQIQQQARAVM